MCVCDVNGYPPLPPSLQVVSSYETGLPHTLDPHTLDTLGLDNFNGSLKLKAFAAHFRLDMRNNVRTWTLKNTRNSSLAVMC